MQKSFFVLFFASLLGVLSTVVFEHSLGQWAGLVFGISPLAIYHLILLRKSGLSSTQIDSIYYFGFLVTVITLVATAISIGLRPQTEKLSISSILLQFGLGLVATGYALFARLQLLSKAHEHDEESVVDATNKLAQSIRGVVNEFNNAGHEIVGLTNLTQQRLSEIEASMDERFAAAENKFRQKLQSAESAFLEGITKLQTETLRTTSQMLTGATQEFSSTVSNLMEEVGRIQTEASAMSFTKATEQIAGFVQEVSVSMRNVSNQVRVAAEQSANGIALANETVKISLDETANATREATSETAAAIKEMTSSVRKVKQLAEDIGAQLEGLHDVNKLIASINSSSEALAQLVNAANDTADAIQSLGYKSGQAEEQVRLQLTEPLAQGDLPAAVAFVQQSLSAFGRVSVSITEKLELLGKPLGDTGVANSMESMNRSLSDFSQLAGTMKESLEVFKMQLIQANNNVAGLVSKTNLLDSHYNSLSKAIDRLAEGVGGVQMQALQFSETLSRQVDRLNQTSVVRNNNALHVADSVS